MADAGAPTRPDWSISDWVALATVTAGAALLRFYRLTQPDVQIFDERTYVKDACFYVAAAGRPPCFDKEITTVHPPLGKWLIGWGIEAGDFAPLGWRISAALAGTLTVALVYLLARRLLRSTLGAVVAAGFLAVDFLHFVHSRIGMLDVFTGLFGVAAFLFVVYDRDRRRAGPGADGPSGLWGRFRARRWRIAAGAAAGLAAATKWQGLLVLLAVVLLTIAWETHAVRVAGDISRREAFNRALAREGVSIVAGLFLVPLLVYSVTFLGRLDGSFLAWPWSSGSFYRALWDRQFSMYEFHRFLVTPSWAGSPVWSWPLVMRPIPYLLDRLPGNEVRFVFGGGNPIMWWASLAALVFVAVEWLRRRSPLGAEGVIVAGFFLGYLPWFALSYRRSAIFIYYMVPLVPFMCLALAYVAVRLWRAVAGRAAVVALAVVATGLFVVEYPLLTGEPVAASTWHSRMWVYDDCQQRYAAAQLFPQTDDSSDTSPLSDAEVLTFEPWCGL